MLEEFIEVMKKDKHLSLTTENGGCLHFEVLRDPASPNTFHFFEMYRDAEAAAAHRLTEHYNMWAAFKAKGGVLSQSVIKGEAAF
jgi:autoinducer 2-degrading protein